MTTTNDGRSVLEREAEAEEAQRKIVAESEQGLDSRCPECGALGSLEEFDGDGEMRCVDCDVKVAIASKLRGLGRK